MAVWSLSVTSKGAREPSVSSEVAAVSIRRRPAPLPVVGVYEESYGDGEPVDVAAAMLLPGSGGVVLGHGVSEVNLPDGLVVFDGGPALQLVVVA